MKNIHVLPTDKPSRLCNVLCTEKSTLTLFEDEMKKGKRFFPENIYITSSEEIKDGDWILFSINGEIEIIKVTTIRNNAFETKEGFGYGLKRCKKIILTTDQDLIDDGVQAIDDEFLEWFVKNPSCEVVEVQDISMQYHEEGYYEYKIIIPEEEAKQETLGQIPEKQENCCTPIGHIRRYKDCIGCDRKPKQETLEEAANNYITINKRFADTGKAFIVGAKWQQERMCSEEIVDILDNVRYWETCPNSYKVIIERFIEQFRNK